MTNLLEQKQKELFELKALELREKEKLAEELNEKALKIKSQQDVSGEVI